MQVTVSSCRAVLFHYKKPFMTGSTPDLSVDEISIEKECKAFEYSKNLSSPSGSFTLELTADRNWKALAGPTDWIIVYLSNDGKESLRVFGNVDRVSQFTTKNDKGLLETSYIITGRDWGKVLEETRIWFDPQNVTRLIAAATDYFAGSPDYLVKTLLDKLLGGKLPYDLLKTQPQFQQWYVPNNLTKYLKVPSLILDNKFYSYINMDLQKVSGFKTLGTNLAQIQGVLWELLKKNSNDVINELYTELINDTPTLTLRIKPFTSKKFIGGSIISEVSKSYFYTLYNSKNQDKVVKVKGEEIIGSDIGYADDERFNLFVLVSTGDFMNPTTVLYPMSQKYPKFPNINEASIKRHGLKYMYLETEFALISPDKRDEQKLNPNLLYDWNRLLFDWYNNAIFYETGTMELKKAHPELRVGKALIVQDSTINQDKVFYIEGYTDSWTFPGAWTQTVQLTRGQYIDGVNETLVLQKDLKKTEKIYTGQSTIQRSPLTSLSKKGNILLSPFKSKTSLA